MILQQPRHHQCTFKQTTHHTPHPQLRMQLAEAPQNTLPCLKCRDLELRHDVDAEFLSQRVSCPMITTSPPLGSTIRGIVDRTDLHGILFRNWKGQNCVSISDFWPNDSTTRTCSTNACVNAVCVILGCPRRACTSCADIAVVLELEPMSTLTSAAAEPPGTARRPARCYVRTYTCGSFSTEIMIVSPHLPGCTTATRNKWCWNRHTSAAMR